MGMAQICSYVGFSETTVLEWIRTRCFPAQKPSGNSFRGGIWISTEELIDEWWVKVCTGEISRPAGVSSRKIGKRPQLKLNVR